MRLRPSPPLHYFLLHQSPVPPNIPCRTTPLRLDFATVHNTSLFRSFYIHRTAPFGTVSSSPYLRAMDKMSKFRRKQKPKPPTIETSVPRASSETTDSLPSEKGTALASTAPGVLTSSSSGTSSPTKGKGATPKPAKKSPFRGLGLRSYRKRARGSPPAELSSSPPQPAVVGQDGAASLKSSKLSTDIDYESQQGDAYHAPKIPGFLSLSQQGELHLSPKGRLGAVDV